MKRAGLLSAVGLIWLSLTLPVEAADLQTILKRGYLVVGVKDNLRPLSFLDAKGQLQGFEVDLARQLAAVLLGSPNAVVLQPVTNAQRLPAVLNDEVDLAIARLTATVSRTRLVSFSTPYYLDGTAFLTRNPSLQNLKDLRQYPIAVLAGADTIATVRSLLPQATLVSVPSYEAAKSALEQGQAAVFAADATVLTGWAQEDPQYRVLPMLISAEPLAVAMPRGVQYDDLRRQVNRAIDQWNSDGDLQRQVFHWGLPDAGVPNFPRNAPIAPSTSP